MFRPECLVEQQHKVSTFYLFSIIIAGGILVVLAGSFTVAQLLYLLRRCIYGRPPNFTPAASSPSSRSRRWHRTRNGPRAPPRPPLHPRGRAATISRERRARARRCSKTSTAAVAARRRRRSLHLLG